MHGRIRIVQAKLYICWWRNYCVLFLILPLLRLCRSNAQVGSWANGREGSNLGPCQVSLAGEGIFFNYIKSMVSSLVIFNWALITCVLALLNVRVDLLPLQILLDVCITHLIDLQENSTCTTRPLTHHFLLPEQYIVLVLVLNVWCIFGRSCM